MIKILLIAGLIGFTALELRGKNSASHLAVRRVIAIVILALGATAIIFPDVVTRLAHLVGVGRGSDLVLYALVIVFLFSTLGLYLRLSRLEERYVELSRRMAIEEAHRRSEVSSRGSDAMRAPSGEVGPSLHRQAS